MAEILEFRVPTGNSRTLLILGLDRDASEARTHRGGWLGGTNGWGHIMYEEPSRERSGRSTYKGREEKILFPRAEDCRIRIEAVLLIRNRHVTNPSPVGLQVLLTTLQDITKYALHSVFSAFGPLYSMKIYQNAPVAGPGYYALVKFYSARDARRAQCACNQQSLFQKSPLKISLCTRQRPFPQQTFILNSYKCQELANYYLGFNGWSSRIITLQNISGLDEEKEEKEVKPPPRSQSSKFLCIQELTIPRYGIRTRGAGVAEVELDPNQDFITSTYNAQKIAVHGALSDAFQKIFIIVLENGKVAVEYSSQEDPIECLTEEELKGLIQVNELSLSQLSPVDDEEILADFSINGE